MSKSTISTFQLFERFPLRRAALRWAAGDAGTEYERIMRARNREDVARMPRKGKPQL